MIETIKYIFLGFKRKFREDDHFRLDVIGYTSIFLFVTVGGYWWTYIGVVGDIDNWALRYLMAGVLGFVSWVAGVIILIFLGSVIGKVINLFDDLVNQGKEEEVRVFKILKGEEKGKND